LKTKFDVPAELLARVVAELREGRTPSMRLITTDMGVSPSLVNHHFHDSSELIKLAWRQIILSSVESDHEVLDQLGLAENWEGLAEFIYDVFSVERQGVRLAHMRAISQALGDDQLREVVMEAQEITKALWVDCLQKHTASGVLAPRVDIDSMAVLFAALPLGITAARLDLGLEERKNIAETWYKIMVAMLKP
jgi:AcrR family transcriptional regulator